jgi:inner membrane transporter RhtA
VPVPGARGAAVAMVLGGVVSVQAGSAAATTLFDEVGPAGTVLYRLVFAAIILVAIWRPHPRRHERRALALAGVFGVALAGMNLCFYEALDRIPLGIAVTFEFLGPLTVAVAGSRRALDLLWVGLAAAGIVLLAGPEGASPDALGIVFALAAGAFWGVYILIGARLGRAFAGGTGLAIAMVLAAALMLVPGGAAGGADLLDPGLAATGFAVAVLSSVVPYSLELEALRRIPTGTFGVMMSLEPAVAATIGFIALDQGLGAAEVAGIGLVVAASAGALREPGAPSPRD